MGMQDKRVRIWRRRKRLQTVQDDNLVLWWPDKYPDPVQQLDLELGLLGGCWRWR